MMNKRNRYLSGILLVLIGILIGGVFVMLQQGHLINDHSAVKVTEIKKSEKPLFSDKDLKKLDTRFLFKYVAKQVTPTVVYISTIVSLDDNEDSGEHHFWDRFRSQRARTVGSGVIISKNGYIVTNNHVIRGAVDDGISVILNDKRIYEARIVGTDPTTDIAILKIDASDLPSITLGNSDDVNVGEWVLAIGNPFRLRSTVTAGIVSALSRQVQIAGESNSELHIDSFIQTDAAINKGNSGGALVNTSGELIGINTAIATESGSYQGYGFAVPSNLVSKVMTDLIQFGEVHRALLGVTISGIDNSRARDLGLKTIKGVEIRSVTKNGAARRANLHQNDVILEVNGQAVNESNELQEKIAVHQPGETVKLTIWRDGSILHKAVILGKVDATVFSSREQNMEAPNAPREPEDRNHKQYEERGVAFGTFSLGFKVMALATPEDPKAFDLFIARVYPSSQASEQGLREGYIIRKVNGKKVQTLKELKKQLSSKSGKSDSFLIQIETQDGATGYYQLKR